MDTKTFLDQLLQAGRELATQGRELASRGRDVAEQRLGIPEEGPERDAALSALGKGAMAGGVLALLLGTSGGRKLTGGALKVGGLAALSALAVEGASGEPFDRYCRAHILAPLGMTETSFRLADLDPSHIAIPQAWQGGRFVELGHHGFPDYPAGTLRKSAPQLARFLLMVMNGREYRGVRLLAPATAREMLTPQYPWLDPSIGLLRFNIRQRADILIGYEGGDPGVNTLMYFRPKDGVGVIVLTNGVSRFPAIFSVAFRLFEEAAHL